MILYNYGLSDAGNKVMHHESHPCGPEQDCTGMAAIRDEAAGRTMYALGSAPNL
jgi:hypothetical protein